MTVCYDTDFAPAEAFFSDSLSKSRKIIFEINRIMEISITFYK